MSGAHTQGPWAQEIFKAANGGQCFGVKSNATDSSVAWTNGRTVDENISNARLIAAAPDLLEACLTLLAWDEAENNAEAFDKDQGKAWRERQALCAASFDKARAAVAKATGGQS